jgi:hypothetical protein
VPLLRNLLAVRGFVPQRYDHSSLWESFAADTTVLITAKDTCSQTLAVLEALQDHMPAATRVKVSLPDTLGCLDSLPLAAARALFPATTITYRQQFNPFAAWLADAEDVTTPFTLLMHNDVYFLDGHGLLQL